MQAQQFSVTEFYSSRPTYSTHEAQQRQKIPVLLATQLAPIATLSWKAKYEEYSNREGTYVLQVYEQIWDCAAFIIVHEWFVKFIVRVIYICTLA